MARNQIVSGVRVRALNGHMFSWPDRGAYKPGDYKKVGECFLPYFDFLNIGGEHVAFDASRSSQRLVDEAGRRDFFQQQNPLGDLGITAQEARARALAVLNHRSQAALPFARVGAAFRREE